MVCFCLKTTIYMSFFTPRTCMMLIAKPMSTPLSTSCDLSPTSDAPSCDTSEFCRIIGSLQYLSLTRLDVSFPINKLSQDMKAPTNIHIQVVKRLLHYLKGIIAHGLHLSCTTDLSLFAYYIVTLIGLATLLIGSLLLNTSSI